MDTNELPPWAQVGPRRREHIARVTLDRPAKLNAINKAMRAELTAVYADVRDNPDVWLMLLTGNGRAFCTGKDLFEEVTPTEPGILSPEDLYVFQLEIYKPIICAINGACLAQGGGLALCSDIRIMSEQAVIDSGDRQVVLVALGEGRFEPRAVQLGRRGDGMIEIMDGLKAGEAVVVAANFLIDAESNLKAALAAFTADAPQPMPGTGKEPAR